MLMDIKRNIAVTDIEMAFSYHQAGQYDKAREIYLRILQLNPDDYNALQLLGTLMLNVGDCRMAATLITRAVTIFDSDPSAFNNLGEAYRELGQLVDAESCFRHALSLDSEYAKAYNNLAVVLHLLKRPQEAADSCRSALKFSPCYAEAYNNLGIILADMIKFDEAEAAYRNAIKLKSEYIAPFVNLGILLKNLGRYKESEQAYKKALYLEPYATETLYNLSLLELLQGKLRKGFAHYENRIEKIDILSEAPSDCPPWHGQKLAGKSLLLVAEQGAGDSLMMMRYLRNLKNLKHPERIAIHCDISLQRIFSLFSEVDTVFSKSELTPFKQFDFHCPIMSLPYLFNTALHTIPQNIPYINVPDEIKSRFQKLFSKLNGLKVGLAWSGNKELKADAKRSIPLSAFEPLRALSEVHFVSLQKGDGAEQLQKSDWDMIDVMDKCQDYLDTASLISHLDLVISVDTSVAHLAAAMGKPVWLLNRFESEWRWMLQREDSPWYQTVKIFRQETMSDWSQVVQRVVQELFSLSIIHSQKSK